MRKAAARLQGFVVSRALRRRLLAFCAPESRGARWHERAGVAPRLLPPWHHWHTSISHASDFVGCAVRNGAPVGIDVEPLARWDSPQSATFARLARRALTPEELAFVMDGPDATRWLAQPRVQVQGQAQAQAQAPAQAEAHRFLLLWTGKEAVLKACGVGLRYAPRHVSLPLAPSPASRGWHGTVRWHARPPSGGLGLHVYLATSVPLGAQDACVVEDVRRRTCAFAVACPRPTGRPGQATIEASPRLRAWRVDPVTLCLLR